MSMKRPRLLVFIFFGNPDRTGTAPPIAATCGGVAACGNGWGAGDGTELFRAEFWTTVEVWEATDTPVEAEAPFVGKVWIWAVDTPTAGCAGAVVKTSTLAVDTDELGCLATPTVAAGKGEAVIFATGPGPGANLLGSTETGAALEEGFEGVETAGGVGASACWPSSFNNPLLDIASVIERSSSSKSNSVIAIYLSLLVRMAYLHIFW